MDGQGLGAEPRLTPILYARKIMLDPERLHQIKVLFYCVVGFMAGMILYSLWCYWRSKGIQEDRLH